LPFPPDPAAPGAIDDRGTPLRVRSWRYRRVTSGIHPQSSTGHSLESIWTPGVVTFEVTATGPVPTFPRSDPIDQLLNINRAMPPEIHLWRNLACMARSLLGNTVGHGDPSTVRS